MRTGPDRSGPEAPNGILAWRSGNRGALGFPRLGWIVLTIVVANAAFFEVADRFFGKSGFAAIPVVRAGMAGTTLFLLVFWWLLSNQWKARFTVSHRIGVLAALMLAWVCLGLYYGSPLGYVASDTFFLFHSIIFLLFLHTYFCRAAAFSVEQGGSSGTFDEWFRVPIWLVATTVAYVISPYQILPPSVAMVVVVAMVGSLLAGKHDMKTVVGGVFMIAYVSGGNRASLLGIAVALLCGLYISPRKRLLQVSLILTFLVTGLSAIADRTGWSPARQRDRITEVWTSLIDVAHGGRIEELPMPLYQRVFEARLVSDRLEEGGIVPIVLGFGAGASLDMSRSDDQSVAESSLLGLESVHNIHLLPYMVLYRYGLTGLVLLGMLVYGMVRHLVVFRSRYVNGRTHLGSLLAATYVLGWLTYSFPAGGFIFENPLMFVCIAAVWAAEKMEPYREHALQSATG